MYSPRDLWTESVCHVLCNGQLVYTIANLLERNLRLYIYIYIYDCVFIC